METDTVLDRSALVKRWHELGADPGSPDYYELNEYGELILSPRPTNDHQGVAMAVGVALNVQLGPESRIDISVMTDRGVRVPDVVWMRPERWAAMKRETPLSAAPDVCVEVLSTGNTRQEIRMKTGAYLRAGAREVIVVGLKGEVECYGPEGPRASSALGITLELPSALF